MLLRSKLSFIVFIASSLAAPAALANTAATWSVALPRNIDTYTNGQALATPADVDGPIVSANLINGTLPPGAVLSPFTGQVTISSVNSLTAGNFGASIKTIDALGGSTTRTIIIRILPDAEAIVDIRPVGGRDEYSVGDTLLSFSDSDGMIIKAKIVSGNLPLGTAFDTVSGTVTVSDLLKLQTGDWSFSIKTTDVTGGGTSIPVNFRFTPYGPLPVTLISFTARREFEKVVLLWKTASELQNDHFEIERSADGRNFKKIGNIAGNLTSNSESTYQFFDRNPLSTQGYYRLKQVDVDGKFAYSPVVAVSAQEETNVLTAYPNPTEGPISISIPSSLGTNVQLTLFSNTGQLVWEGFAPAGVQPQLNLNQFPDGYYLLRCQSKEGTLSVKIKKQ